MGAGTSAVGDPGQWPFLPEAKGRTAEELPDTVITSKDPKTLRRDPRRVFEGTAPWAAEQVQSLGVGTGLAGPRGTQGTRAAGVVPVGLMVNGRGDFPGAWRSACGEPYRAL